MELLNEGRTCLYEARIDALLTANQMLIELLIDVQAVLSRDNLHQRLKFEQIQVALDHLSSKSKSQTTHVAATALEAVKRGPGR